MCVRIIENKRMWSENPNDKKEPFNDTTVFASHDWFSNTLLLKWISKFFSQNNDVK